MATASTFSYAQAAKGQGSITPSNAAPQAQESLPASSASQTKPPVEHSSEPTDVVQNGSSQTVSSEKQDVASNNGVEAEAQTESARGSQRELPRDDESGRLDRPWRQNDKGTRSSSNTTRSIDEQDSRKQRRSKKAKGSEKTPTEQTVEKEQEPVPEPPKVELSEAPIPSVNIWQQRKEAQLAKVKPAPAGATEQTVSGLTNGAASTKNADDAASVTSRDHATNGTKPVRRPGDAPRAERNANRGPRVAEREVREGRTDSPPLVSDAAAWPTPETAIKEDKKKPAEKADRPEKENQTPEDAAHSKPRQKWVTYDYVPTVNFETQLPQLRSSKPRSPRTPNPRGTNSTTGEKTASSAQPPKTTEARDRPRDNAGGPSRSAMSPPASKRTPETPQAREQKKQPMTSVVAERPKETPPTSSEQSPAVRERPEGGRNERGRGGFRGRGGHHSVNSHHQQHVGSGFAGAGPLAARPQGPYSPPNRQVGHGQVYIPQQQRGSRGGRGNGGNSFHRMSLPNGAPRVSPLQTHYRAYDYPMAISAMPFQPQPQPQHQPQPQPQPYWDNMVVPLLKSQIEYYFSIENLCKDMYLRARMDSQGFVPLAFIAAFKRVRDLSADIGFIRAVCEMSTEIDFVVGDDDMERIRRREGWEKFVLPLEDRDEFSRNHGPARITFKNRGFQMPPHFNGMTAAYGMASPPAYPVPGEIAFQQMPDESVLSHGYGGHINGHVAGHGMTSQLSADVPDFSPSGSIPFSPQPNGIMANGFVVDGSNGALANGSHEQPDETQSA